MLRLLKALFRRRVVRVRNECHRDAIEDVDRRVVVNPGRMVGHVDDDVRRGIERAIAAITAAVHLRVRRQGNEQQERERLKGSFHKRSELAIDFGAVLNAVDADEFLRGIHPIEKR